VGFDDVPPAGWPAYDLTTLRQRSNMMVQETVSALLDHINQPAAVVPRKIAIDGPLVVRGSAKTPEGYDQ
jgi:DNA-binding LacI/PurR family transcriptional regulator